MKKIVVLMVEPFLCVWVVVGAFFFIEYHRSHSPEQLGMGVLFFLTWLCVRLLIMIKRPKLAEKGLDKSPPQKMDL